MKTRNILIVTKNLPPQVGGIERLTFKTIEILSKNFQCTIVGPKESEEFISESCNYIGCNSNNLLVFFFECLFKSIIASCRTKYDISYAASGLVSPIIRISSIFSKSKCITYIHGLDIAAKNYIYKLLFVPLILSSDLILTNSQNTSRLIKGKGYKKDVVVINPGVDIPYLNNNGSKFKNDYSLDKNFVLLTVGRLVKRKGVAEFILNSLPMIVKKYPNVMYVVIGEEASNAVKQELSTREKILVSIREANMYKHVLMIDKVSDEDLESAYMCSSVFVFPLLDSSADIEGFGMVAAEAGACGLKTVAFNVGGVADAVIEGKTGSLIPSQDYNSMTENICMFLKKQNNNSSRKECQGYAKSFSWERFGVQIYDTFLKL